MRSGPLHVDSELVDDVRRILRRQGHVLGVQRIDRRRPDERVWQALVLGDVLMHVVDVGVVAGQRGQEEREHVGIRRREVDVAAPDPGRARVREPVDHRRGLRIVDADEVVVVLELLCVQLVVALEDLLLVGGQADLGALERVVDRLRDVEELIRALDDPPLDVEPGVAHQRNQRVVDLGDAAAEGRRGQVYDALALKRLGEPPDLIHQPTRGDSGVVRQRLGPGVDELKHGQPARITVG